jgi:hypothetical protein
MQILFAQSPILEGQLFNSGKQLGSSHISVPASAALRMIIL